MRVDYRPKREEMGGEKQVERQLLPSSSSYGWIGIPW